MERLPIYDQENELVAALRRGNRLVVSAPTGSGKSTQIPRILWRHGLLDDGQAVILQPRRIAARMLAARVAEECCVNLGDAVGYQMRFENVSGPHTRIKYITEGILFRRMLDDPRLAGVAVVIFDEFHERHLYGDISLALVLRLQETERPDLKIVVMSATLDTDLVADYLAPCAMVQSEGRVFPVNVEYSDQLRIPERDPVWDQAVRAFEKKTREGVTGDVLVFMPGGYEIRRTISAFQACGLARDCIVLPLYGELAPRDQDAAVATYAQRKIVVATNVAETSLTIRGVTLVIDSGLARIPRHDPHRGINTLWIERISQASAVQRSGRAGRTAAGHCVRLWSVRDQAGRPLRELPEIRRLDLAETLLAMKAAGIHDMRDFPWIEKPDDQALTAAECLLTDLGALDGGQALTATGRSMLAFPIHPRYARMLLAAQDYGCVRTVCLIAALTQERNLLLRNQGKQVLAQREEILGEDEHSDFFILMRAWNYAVRKNFHVGACRALGVHAETARQVRRLFDLFKRIAEHEGLRLEERPASDEAVQRCLLIGFSDQLARRLDKGTLRCDLVQGRRGVLVRESAVHGAELFTAAEIHEIEGADKKGQVLLSLATAVEEAWLVEFFPADFSETEEAELDPAIRRVVSVRRKSFRDLVLEERRGQHPPPDASTAILAREIAEGRMALKNWDNRVEQWIARINTLADRAPDLGMPRFEQEDRRMVLEQLCLGSCSYKQIKDKPVWPELKKWLSPAMDDLLERYMPERLQLPCGRRVRINYADGAQPYIAARIQDLYDVTQPLTIAGGKIKLLIHILAPNQRPVQITDDLPRFWTEHYPKIKQELRRKYHKHEWR